ncbi:MAG TPA: hypothetical protein VME23_01820 [Terracidiphilus sp.]|nr:hypothetical protein [Terracidiphilus sp.]
MRCDRPLILALIFVGLGLAVIIGYGNGHTEFNVSYPLSGSVLSVSLATYGPAVLGGIAVCAIGSLFLVWAFFAAIVSLFTGGVQTHEREERYSVVPRMENSDSTAPETTDERGHFWSNQSSRTNL